MVAYMGYPNGSVGEGVTPDAVEQRPQPTAEKNAMCMQMCAGVPMSLLGAPANVIGGGPYEAQAKWFAAQRGGGMK